VVSEKTYTSSLSLEKRKRKRGGSNTYTREIEIVVPKIAHTRRLLGRLYFTGPFPLSERETFLSLSFFSVFTFFFSFPKRELFSSRAATQENTTRITLYLSPSLEHRHTLKTDINHAVSSCIYIRLSFSLVRSALLFLERTNARRFRFLVNCKNVAHCAFHMRTFPNAH
jgi:hypothetical protein